jgi:RNA polymerase sigma-70 factor, ECF subfamily
MLRMRPTLDPDPEVSTGEAGLLRSASQVRDEVSAVATDVKLLVQGGNLAQARERFAEVVRLEQRRASRIAYHFLRDGAEADEAVQDAFLKVFSHISSFREEMPFEVWFTRILINGCLDRQKARRRRARWLVPAADTEGTDRNGLEAMAGSAPSPEDLLVDRERRRRLAAAVGTLRGRQRTVFLLCHFDGRSPREVGALTGLNESTVRVHLFRAVRKLRARLEGSRETD